MKLVLLYAIQVRGSAFFFLPVSNRLHDFTFTQTTLCHPNLPGLIIYPTRNMETGDKANPPFSYPAPSYYYQQLPRLWKLPRRKAFRAQQARDTYTNSQTERHWRSSNTAANNVRLATNVGQERLNVMKVGHHVVIARNITYSMTTQTRLHPSV